MPAALGRYGAWMSPATDDKTRKKVAVEAEKLGYATVWFGIGASSVEDLGYFEEVLDATDRITVATAIVNMWTNDAGRIAAAYHRLTERHGERFVLGVGVGHPESITTYQSPYQKMVAYLDQLDAEGVPAEARVLAALGDRSLELAATRTRGAHPYLVVPKHTEHARAVLGPSALLAPEHKVVVDDDPVAARAIGRPFVHKPYLGLRNYVNNLRRLGYTDADVSGEGSDRLIDDLVLHGTPAAIHGRLAQHLNAGADHVGVHVLGPDPLTGYRRLAEVLL
ncbi:MULTISPECIES: LLM class F420-dependent oxidoreductase [unclassified Amycolatopsis]|uniref:LLM class F420-dependent oxidoreductase n=1 Tax=unclassified Amycolatopsis TaxID=2618356 RepID=UPI001C69DF7F|nr:LLM class F420-dependent oxidoreductase [Amycolatopsis sp. DSM 110486]QYN22417.1 LLM class F420-dependent oxidoreductase [Amycolatopsis sp. DSM 110486]